MPFSPISPRWQDSPETPEPPDDLVALVEKKRQLLRLLDPASPDFLDDRAEIRRLESLIKAYPDD